MTERHLAAVVGLACVACVCPALPAAEQSPRLPEPTFVVPFDGTAQPKVAAGRAKHPSLKADDTQCAEGLPRHASAVLLRHRAQRAAVGHLAKKPGEVTVRMDLSKVFKPGLSPFRGTKRVKKKGELMQVVERIGTRDARVLETGPNHVKLWVAGHSMVLVELTGHQRLR